MTSMTLTEPRQRDRPPAQAADRARALDGARRRFRSTAGPSTASRTPTAPPGRPATASSRSRIRDVEVPADWPLEEARLDVDLGGEGLLRIAYADGGGEAFGLDPNHQRFPLKARRFAVSAECVARLPFGVPNRDARLARARLIRLDPDLAELTLLLDPGRRDRRGARRPRGGAAAPRRRRGRAAPGSTGRPPPPPTSRASRRARSRSGSGSCRPTSTPHPAGLDDAPARPSSARAARLPARAACARCASRYPQTGALALTGHAHIDLAWLWPLAETRRKAQPHLLDHGRPDGPLPRVPLQPVDRPALRLPRGGRPGALRRASRRRSPPASGSRSARCGSSPTPTCRPASPSSASSSTASATSSGPSAAATRSAGCPTASASRRRCRSS